MIIETINELERKGIRVCISPQCWYGKWNWYAGIYVGNDRRAIWIDSDNGLPKAAYETYEDAFNAIINYCKSKKLDTAKSNQG